MEDNDSYQYEAVSLSEFDDIEGDETGVDLGEDYEGLEEPDEDLQEAIRELQRRTQELSGDDSKGSQQKRRPHGSTTSSSGRGGGDKDGHEVEKKYDEEDSDPKAETVVKPSAIEDFIRNFLIKKKMHKTLDTFNTEWYEQKEEGTLADHPEDEVPDIYQQNQELEEQINRIKIELNHAQVSGENDNIGYCCKNVYIFDDVAYAECCFKGSSNVGSIQERKRSSSNAP